MVMLLTIASLAGTALAPLLLVKSPLLLVAISPAAHHVALAAASVAPLTLIVVTTLRRALTAGTAYGLGYEFGGNAQQYLGERSPRLARLASFLERQLERFGLVVLVLIPLPVVALLVGATRRSFPLFCGALLIGLAIWSTVTYHLGDWLSAFTDRLTAFLGQYLMESTLVCFALVLLQQLVSRYLRRGKPAGP
jgi:membrane protein DedA with SNARE-associated domain